MAFFYAMTESHTDVDLFTLVLVVAKGAAMPGGRGDGKDGADEPFADQPYAEGALGRMRRFEWRHRKVVYPVLAIVGIGLVWLIDPGDWKWIIGIMFVLAASYQAAKGRAFNTNAATARDESRIIGLDASRKRKPYLDCRFAGLVTFRSGSSSSIRLAAD